MPRPRATTGRGSELTLTPGTGRVVWPQVAEGSGGGCRDTVPQLGGLKQQKAVVSQLRKLGV